MSLALIQKQFNFKHSYEIKWAIEFAIQASINLTKLRKLESYTVTH